MDVLVPQCNGEVFTCGCNSSAYILGRRFQRYGSLTGNIKVMDVCEIMEVKRQVNSFFDIRNLVRRNRRPVLAIIKSLFIETYKLYEYDKNATAYVSVTMLVQRRAPCVS